MLFTLLAVMLKEFRQALRDRRMAVILLAAPVIQLTLLGYAVDLEVDHIPTVLADLDHTPASRDLGAALVADQTFTLVGQTGDPERASRCLEDGTAAVAIVIPVGFARDLDRKTPVAVEVLVDGTDSTRAQIAANSAAQFMAERGVETSLTRWARCSRPRAG